MIDVLAVIQARMGSTRLPRKVLRPVNGRPLLWYLVQRVRSARGIDGVVVATTVEPADDEIEDFCRLADIPCFRGSEGDVLDRYYQAALAFPCRWIVRITGDCPLIDPAVIERVVRAAVENTADYTSNTNPPTYPDGMDVEAFTFDALSRAWKEAAFKYQREHVTSFMTEHPEAFRCENVPCDEDLSSFRLTVDAPEDFAVVERIIQDLGARGRLFGLGDIISYVRSHPDIRALNAARARNENYNIDDK
ncbi:MAG: glycosyltransferase family protein [Candidatus Omnitrophica bacterium]|nr:glycosyltransferase family protein [Candidatus Omnitrophota bacterium]